MMAPQKPTEPELLARVSATGKSDREVERSVPLPQGFLSKGRKGGNADPRAHPSWVRLRQWLDQNFPKQGGALAAVLPGPVAPAAPAPAPIVYDDTEGRRMDAAIDDANTYDKMDSLMRWIIKAIRRGDLTPLVGSRMIDGVREKRLITEANDKQKATISSGATVVVRVEHVNDWRREPDVAEVKDEG